MASAGRPEPRAHSSQALQTGASAPASRQRPSQADASSQRPAWMASRRLAEPDPVVLRGQLAGLLQGPLQAVVGQPGQVEVAELLEVAGRVLRLRQAGAVQGLDVVESDLDLIDLAQQIADLVAARAAAAPGPARGAARRRAAAPATGWPSPRGTRRGDRRHILRAPGRRRGARRRGGRRVPRRPPASNRPHRPAHPGAPPGRSAVDAPPPAGRSRSPAAASRSSPRALQASSWANRAQPRASSPAPIPIRRQRRLICIIEIPAVPLSSWPAARISPPLHPMIALTPGFGIVRRLSMVSVRRRAPSAAAIVPRTRRRWRTHRRPPGRTSSPIVDQYESDEMTSPLALVPSAH